MSFITLLTSSQISSMDRIHNTRRKTAQRAAEVTANFAPEILGQVEPEAVPQPAIRGRGRGRARGRRVEF